VAVEAKLVCSVHGRSDHQPRSRTLHGHALGAKTIEVNASHVSLISQADAITRLILEAVGQA
jgi:hypothetical protein